MKNITWEELIQAGALYNKGITLADIIPLIPENLRDKSIRIGLCCNMCLVDMFFDYEHLCVNNENDIVIKEFKSLSTKSNVNTLYISDERIDGYSMIVCKEDIIEIDVDLDASVAQEIYFNILNEILKQEKYRSNKLVFYVLWEIGPLNYDDITISVDINKFSMLYQKDKTAFHNEIYIYLKNNLGDIAENDILMAEEIGIGQYIITINKKRA